MKAKFDNHFEPQRNVIYERARFNQRRQQEGETVDNFITDLHSLADCCGYGSLRNKMIRDRIVVGLLDAKLSERLQLNSNLTLELAVTQARQSEEVHKQQTVVRNKPQLAQDIPDYNADSDVVDVVHSKGFKSGDKGRYGHMGGDSKLINSTQTPGNKPQCSRCGKTAIADINVQLKMLHAIAVGRRSLPVNV